MPLFKTFCITRVKNCFVFFFSSFEPLHHTYDRMEVGVKLVTVSVRKDPNFGFHIMGGIDSGGNPYRTDDDGVFITYVTPGGAADGKVQQGDKILMVMIS